MQIKQVSQQLGGSVLYEYGKLRVPVVRCPPPPTTTTITYTYTFTLDLLFEPKENTFPTCIYRQCGQGWSLYYAIKTFRYTAHFWY